MIDLLLGQEDLPSRSPNVKYPDKEDQHVATAVSKSGTSTPDSDFITAEVMFTDVRPQTGHFELVPSDSDEPSSSGSGTPIPHRVRLVRERDMEGGAAVGVTTEGGAAEGGATAVSTNGRTVSHSPMNVVEACNVKSSEANMWRKQAMEG